ncbi:NPC intracellular cholesterol transporter 1 [Sarcoptes scabiei]|uniref:Niemann-Pick C1 -like protein 1 n=1 Tax=Sarcoptes scabiei TaxID=52283 RepID=A0A834RF41_SARSC|nr:NPC intracellular cholesterol transporter 1 [Sarcoptes scabiei]
MNRFVHNRYENHFIVDLLSSQTITLIKTFILILNLCGLVVCVQYAIQESQATTLSSSSFESEAIKSDISRDQIQDNSIPITINFDDLNDRNISTIIKTKNRSKNQKNSNRKNRNKQKIDSNLKLLASSNQAELFRNEPLKTCLIADSCGKKNSKHSTGYCYRPHEPYNYSVDDPEIESFYDMMLESCPHFFNEDELLHPLCCNVEMEETMSRLIMSVDLIRRSCPSCLINVKKLFCNLFCLPNQRDFLRIDRIEGEKVIEATYALSERFVETFFHSCQDVQVFGAYLMDYESACGKLKRSNCTAKDFLRMLGSLNEIPFKFRPLIIDNENELDVSQQSSLDRWPRAIMNDTAYRCDEAPPNQSKCRCDHCQKMCLWNHHNPHQRSDLKQKKITNNRINVRHISSSSSMSRIAKSSSSITSSSSSSSCTFVLGTFILVTLIKI